MKYFKSYGFQHALSIAITINITFLLSRYLNNPLSFWMVLIAFLVSPSTCGTSLRQSLLSAFFILFILLLVSGLFWLQLATAINLSIISLIYILLCLWLANIMPFTPLAMLVFISFCVVLLFLLQPIQNISFSALFIAAFIGLLGGQLILPPKITREYKLGLVPIFYAIRHYLNGILQAINQHNYQPRLFFAKRTQLEHALLTYRGIFPQWVYEVGFNRGLRTGYRAFLINLEILAEEIFILSHIANQPLPFDLIKEIQSPVNQVAIINNELLTQLIHYFTVEEITFSKLNYLQDIIELEQQCRNLIPDRLELLEMLPEYLIITIFVQSLKNFRERLLQLMSAIS